MPDFIVKNTEDWREYVNACYILFGSKNQDKSIEKLQPLLTKLTPSAVFHGFENSDELISYINHKIKEEKVAVKERSLDDIVFVVQCWFSEDSDKAQGE